jgi:hypothetical protein
MSDNTTTVYLSEGALAQKRCYHTDPDDCQSIGVDEDTREVTKEVAEDEMGLVICSWCDDSATEHPQDLTYNNILRNADPDDGWEGVRERLDEVDQEAA